MPNTKQEPLAFSNLKSGLPGHRGSLHLQINLKHPNSEQGVIIAQKTYQNQNQDSKHQSEISSDLQSQKSGSKEPSHSLPSTMI